jgi:MinD-like ATPase involved in chromosome partitioning or flagellar assembly
MAETIAVLSLKGGTGKTTTVRMSAMLSTIPSTSRSGL